MADKVVFIAFAIEDEAQRNLFTGQRVNAKTPFTFTDMSVKEPYDTGWKDRVRTRIRRSDGVIALMSKSSANSTGQKWEVQCAKEENKPIRGIYLGDDRTKFVGVDTVTWTWPNVAAFIDSL
jgi:hypothetical protein